MNCQIGICDDNQIDINYLSDLVENWALTAGQNVKMKTFPSAEAFLFHYEEDKNFDILLLDIEMKELSGMELAKKLRQENKTVQIVFITGYPDYISEGYDVTALHYLMKPVKAEKLCEVLDRAKEMLEQQPRSLLFDAGKESIRVYADDILYAESQGHYILLHTKKAFGGREEHKFRMTISELGKKLGAGFYKCGRSFIVNLKYVSRITKTSVFLEQIQAQPIELPLGKGLYDDMNKALIQYLRER